MKQKTNFISDKIHDHNNIGFKVSSLYYTLEDLIKNKSPLLSDITLKHDGSKSVIYINFNTNPIYNIYQQEYQFDQRHLTIHKFYKERKKTLRNGLSIAHYTETYSSTVNNSQIVIHIYFDKQGFYQYTQIKQYDGKRNETNYIELSCDSGNEKMLRENSQDVSDFLQELINQNLALCHAAMQNAERIELELRNISHTFEKNSIQRYQKTADDFIKAIEQVNLHNDNYYDKRGLLVAQQMNDILTSCLKKGEVPNEEKACSSKEHAFFKAPPVQKQVKIKKLKNSKYDEILSLEVELTSLTEELKKSSDDISLLIKKKEIVSQIRINSLIISSDFASLKPGQKKKLNELSKLDFNLMEIFTAEFWKGNIENVRLLYPHIENKITFGFILDKIIWPLIYTMPINQEHESKLRIVFDFLYQESSQYRLYLSNQANILFEKEGHEKEAYASLLVTACHGGNLFAVTLFLEQGMNPNNMGLLIGDVQIPALFCMVKYGESEQHVYLQEALKFGAHYTCKPQLFSVDSKLTKRFNKLNNETLSLLKTFGKSTPVMDLNSILEYRNFIDCLCHTKNFEAIELFLPQLMFEDILYVFTNVSTRTNIMQRHLLPGSNVGCIVAKNIQDLYKITKERLAPSIGLYSIIIYSENQNAHINLIEKLADNLQSKIQHLATTNPDLLKKVYNDLYMKATSFNQANRHYLNTVWQLDACLYLLIYEPKPTVMTYQTMIQIYCHKAVRTKSTMNEIILLYYQIAKSIAEQSCFAPQLMNTPIYQFINKKISAYDVTNIPIASLTI